MKINYNIHEAISLRGLTLNEAGLYDVQYMHPSSRDEIITFRLSMEIASIDNQFGNIPMHIEVLGNVVGYNQIELRAQTTKKEWKRVYSLYRSYMRQGYNQPEMKMYI